MIGPKIPEGMAGDPVGQEGVEGGAVDRCAVANGNGCQRAFEAEGGKDQALDPDQPKRYPEPVARPPRDPGEQHH